MLTSWNSSDEILAYMIATINGGGFDPDAYTNDGIGYVNDDRRAINL